MSAAGRPHSPLEPQCQPQMPASNASPVPLSVRRRESADVGGELAPKRLPKRLSSVQSPNEVAGHLPAQFPLIPPSSTALRNASSRGPKTEEDQGHMSTSRMRSYRPVKLVAPSPAVGTASLSHRVNVCAAAVHSSSHFSLPPLLLLPPHHTNPPSLVTVG